MTLGKQIAQALPGADHAPSEEATADIVAVPTKFRNMTVDERQWELHQRGLLGHRPHITDFFLSLLGEAEEAIENAIGYVGIPLGVLPSVLVNEKEYIVPMATEERSVIASAAKAAKMCALTGGVTVQASVRPSVPVQIMYVAPPQPRSFQRRLCELVADIEGIANDHGGHMEKRGGTPVRAGQAYLLGDGDYAVLPMEIDTCDAMGANVVTRVAEKVAAFLYEKCGMPRHDAVICSNDEAGWRVSASAVWPITSLSRRERMLHVARWANLDPTRAVTHNKGIMNGISAVALATGQDTRAIEACAHASAMRGGDYSPLSQFGLCDTLSGHPAIGGTLTLRIPCGTAGGATQRPFFKECLELMGNPNAQKLASVMAAVGLLQNFAALWSLAGEGIPASHERLKK